jgi:signal peptidase I
MNVIVAMLQVNKYKIMESLVQIHSIQKDKINPEQNPTVGSFLWELVRVILIAFVLMIVFRYFIAEPFIVSGSSMVPNFHNREYLVVNKLKYKFTDPQRGDVIVFKYPKDPSQFFIKRVIGLPGEKVKVENGKVTIFNSEHPDGKVLQEPYLPDQNITFGKNDTVTVGTDEYFMLGDNRLASSDSRVWGVMPKYDIIGTASFRAFPLNELGVLSFPDPSF